MRYLNITENLHIVWNEDWLDACKLSVIKTGHFEIAEDYEQSLCVGLMGDQSGRTNWSVTYSQIDGPQQHRSGRATDDAEGELNRAIAELLAHWLPQFQPKD